CRPVDMGRRTGASPGANRARARKLAVAVGAWRTECVLRRSSRRSQVRTPFERLVYPAVIAPGRPRRPSGVVQRLSLRVSGAVGPYLVLGDRDRWFNRHLSGGSCDDAGVTGADGSERYTRWASVWGVNHDRS